MAQKVFSPIYWPLDQRWDIQWVYQSKAKKSMSINPRIKKEKRAHQSNNQPTPHIREIIPSRMFFANRAQLPKILQKNLHFQKARYLTCVVAKYETTHCYQHSHEESSEGKDRVIMVDCACAFFIRLNSGCWWNRRIAAVVIGEERHTSVFKENKSSYDEKRIRNRELGRLGEYMDILSFPQAPVRWISPSSVHLNSIQLS